MSGKSVQESRTAYALLELSFDDSQAAKIRLQKQMSLIWNVG